MVSIDFTTSWHEGDIQLVISEDGEEEDKTLFASKCTLSIWSPVFAAMFKDTFKEGTNKQVKMPNKKYDDVLELLKVLHPPNKPVTLENAYCLLLLAHEYQIQDVVDRCEEKIITDKPTIANIKLAEDYNLKKLQDHSTKLIATLSLAQIEGDENYSTVSDKSKVELMSKRVQGLEDQVSVLNNTNASAKREIEVLKDNIIDLTMKEEKHKKAQQLARQVHCCISGCYRHCPSCEPAKVRAIVDYLVSEK